MLFHPNSHSPLDKVAHEEVEARMRRLERDFAEVDVYVCERTTPWWDMFGW